MRGGARTKSKLPSIPIGYMTILEYSLYHCLDVVQVEAARYRGDLPAELFLLKKGRGIKPQDITVWIIKSAQKPPAYLEKLSEIPVDYERYTMAPIYSFGKIDRHFGWSSGTARYYCAKQGVTKLDGFNEEEYARAVNIARRGWEEARRKVTTGEWHDGYIASSAWARKYSLPYARVLRWLNNDKLPYRMVGARYFIHIEQAPPVVKRGGKSGNKNALKHGKYSASS